MWSLDDLSADLNEPTSELLSVPGIGRGVAALIEEFRQRGRLRAIAKLEALLPREALAISRLSRMTPKRLHALKALGVETIDDLRQSIAHGDIEQMSGVGEKTIAYWLRALVERRPGIPIYQAQSFARQLATHIEEHVPGVSVSVGGAVARLEEWIQAIELAASDPKGVDEFISSSAVVASLPVAVKTVKARCTGDVYSPAATDIRGDLHCHTEWSPDGRQSLSQLVRAALELGYEYIGITDHAVGLRFGGLDADRLRAQRIEIEKARADHPEIAILHGIELNIGRDGTVDFEDDFLAWLDFTVAGVHSFLGLGMDEQTSRVLRAISNPHVDIIAHLTGRRIGIRPPIDLDLPAVLRAAAANGTVLEVNGHLDRLDLSFELIEMAVGYGVLFVANSDAHRSAELANVENACVLLERARVDRASVVNTWSLEALKTRL